MVRIIKWCEKSLWMDGWVGVKAVLRITYSNQKERGKNELITRKLKHN